MKKIISLALAIVLMFGLVPVNTIVGASDDGYGAISTGGSHSLALKSDGSLWAWGYNLYGQVGDGTNTDRQTPVKIMDDIMAVSAGGWHSLAIKSDGSLWAWGSNLYGQLGDGITEGSLIPIQITLPATPIPTPDPLSAASEWAVADITEAIDADLVPAALQNNYTNNITRAEFCALAVTLYEDVMGKEITGRIKFTDTDDVNVEKAAYINVVNGMGDGTFAPDALLNREQAATMLARLADAVGKPLTQREATFADNEQISSWAIDAVGQMQASGIMRGVSDTVFAPKSQYTREQSIITILRLFNFVK
jgi:hypothetical protein